MVEKLKLNVKLIDKHKIYNLKAQYDPTSRIAEAKRGWRETTSLKFLINPDHIYEEFTGIRRQLTCYVDNSKRTSIEMERAKTIVEDGKEKKEIVKEPVEVIEAHKIHSDDPIDQKQTIQLDFLIDRAFWKSVIEKRKLALSTVLTFLIAGVGIYTLLVTFLRACGINV